MKKQLILGALVLIIIAGAIFYYMSARTSTGLQNDPSRFIFAQIKKSCKVFGEEATSSSQYLNTQLGIQFMFPNDTVVCERLSPNNPDGTAYEVSVWNKQAFLSDVLQQPLTVIHVDDTDAEQLPEAKVLDSTTHQIAGIAAKMQHVQSSSCTGNSCRVFTLFTFEHNTHHYVIEQWTEVPNLIDSLSFVK